MLVSALSGALGLAVAATAAADERRIERLNAEFLEHLNTLPVERSLAVETIRSGWRLLYEGRGPAGFVPDALAVLHADFAEALRAFDEQRAPDAVRLLEPLTSAADPYLAANAAYFHARALIDLGLLEEAERALANATAAEGAIAELARRTPYAPHALFLLAYAQSTNLRYEQAQQTLAVLREAFDDAPEPVRVGGRQLALEIERRQDGTLSEVAELMSYSAQRLRVTDTGQRVRARQDEALALLDRMIEEAEQQEAQNSGGGRRQAQGAQPRGSPDTPATESRVEPGQGQIGDLYGAPRADPGDMWGRLPPAERERILQDLRDRFPSRYQQLVEQYYRSLAEQK
ncbi:MAG TPA: hypothetical protein PKC49_00985 [Phycisphaerae bacterium]|nr:hypothetical protein [Phycisphaerae bacterium]